MREFLDALGLTGKRFAVAKKVGGIFTPAVFTSAEDAFAWIDADGDAGEFDVWITANPIKAGVTGRPRAEDVKRSTWLLLDADPVKTADDPDGLSEDSREAAHALVTEAVDALGGSAIIVDSGRGTQAAILTDGTWGDDLRRQFLRYIASELARPGCKVDATQDASRLMRLPGYTNSRTGRVAMTLSERTGAAITAEEAREFIGEWTESVVDTDASFDDMPPTAADLAWLSGEARGLWDTPPEGDRSSRDYVFTRLLLSAGAPKDVTCRLLWGLPFGKASEDGRDERYWLSTLASVQRSQHEAATRGTRLVALMAEVVNDPSAAFAPQALVDLAETRRDDVREWQRLRSEFKALRSFRLGDLEEAMVAAGAEALGPPDDVARLVVSTGREDFWLLRSKAGEWIISGGKSVEKALQASGGSWDAARREPWISDSLPFAPQWLDGRRFNASRAQWRVAPVPGPYPMWEQLLRVVGRGLDTAVAEDPWCVSSGLPDGGCYLFAWLACMAQHPGDRTAWLFVFSARQNIGKSMFHEAIGEHLLSGGITKADKALVNDRGFNSELEGAVFVTVEETNLGRARSLVRERMKDLITGKTIGLEGKGRDVRTVRNWTHGYQTANSASFCPMPEGDTRVTAWEMLPPLAEEKIDKASMDLALSAEAPAMLHALLSWVVPLGGDGRLRVPVVGTAAKLQQQRARQGMLSVWRDAYPAWVGLEDDALVLEAQRWLAARGEDLRYWRRATILERLPNDERTRSLRKATCAMRKLGTWEGTTASLSTAIGWSSSRSLGRVLAELERRRVPGVNRSDSSEGMRVALGEWD